MNHLPDLRASLVRAAAREYAPARPTWPAIRVALAGVAAVVAIAVAAVALTELRHAPQRAPSAPGESSRQRLIDTISVLRRPQTPADLDFPIQILRGYNVPILAARGTPDLPLIRYAMTTPWGERLYFVPLKPPTAAAIRALEREQPGLPRRFIASLARRGESLAVYSGRGGGGGATAAEIDNGLGDLEIEGAGRSFAGGLTRTRLIFVVPDGVAMVRFVFPREPDGRLFGGPVYRHTLSVRVPVRDNVAAVQVKRECCGGRPRIVWYAADGQVIKRFGNFASLDRVVAPPMPGPETARARAAQRDPATPNRVWVTPGIGGPHTIFRIHFRVLLNGVDYTYKFSGTRCPRFTFPGGTGKPNALRGSLWSDPVLAVEGQALCPGSYRVAVSVMDRGRAGDLRHPARPFGSARFRVR